MLLIGWQLVDTWDEIELHFIYLHGQLGKIHTNSTGSQGHRNFILKYFFKKKIKERNFKEFSSKTRVRHRHLPSYTHTRSSLEKSCSRNQGSFCLFIFLIYLFFFFYLKPVQFSGFQLDFYAFRIWCFSVLEMEKGSNFRAGSLLRMVKVFSWNYLWRP